MNQQTMISKCLLFIGLSLMLLMMNIDFSGVSLALPSISNELHINLSALQWIINAYAIAAASVVLIAGRWGDSVGLKKSYLIGVILFAGASLPIAMAHHLSVINGFRIIQGIGAAIAWPLGIVLFKEAFPKEQQGFALGLAAMIMGLSISIGPPITGFILAWWNWRILFLLNLPLGLIVFILSAYTMPVLRLTNKQLPPSYFQCAFYILIIISFMVALMWGQVDGVLSYKFLLAITTSIISCVIFLLLQKRTHNPLIPRELFQNPLFLVYLIIRLGWQLVWFMMFLTLSIMLQNIFNVSAFNASLILLCFTFSFGAISPFSGKLNYRTGANFLILLGLSIMIISETIFMCANVNSESSFFIFPLILAGVALGVSFPNLLAAGLASVSTNLIGLANGALYTALFIGTAMGATLTGWIIQICTMRNLQSYEFAHLSSSQMSLYKKLASGALNNQSVNLSHVDQLILLPLIKHNFLNAFFMVNLLGMILCVVMMMLLFFVARRK